MASKRKGAPQTRREKKKRYHGPQDEDPNHINPPQLSHSGSSQGITAPSVMISSSNQHPTDRPFLRCAAQSNLAKDHIASTSTASSHLAYAQDDSGTSHHLTPRPPPLRPRHDISQGISVETHPRNVQNDRSQGSFTNAHDFTIGSAVFYNGDRSGEDRRARKEKRAQEEQKARMNERAGREKRTREEREAEEKIREGKALEQLAAKGMPGAMLDSKDRGYVPRCNEDTRQALRVRIIKWVRDGMEVQRLLWVSGPAGVGKSAVAQTVAEELKQRGLLGAVFFFSRPNNRSDPDVVIPTLVYQLALLLPEYRRVISEELIRNPLILNKNRHSQFKELIINPFLSLTAQLPSLTQPPLLIILDGLDECNDREAQREFVEMISHHTHKEGAALRLRWLVCSRPEPDLKVLFSGKDCRATCVKLKLEVDDGEARNDARRILETGFADIRRRYPDQLSRAWPTDDQVSFIADRASGHLGFVSFVIRFIGNKYYDDPSGQLDICLKFLKRTDSSTDVNPLSPLDLLYTQVLSDVPENTLPTTQRILALTLLSGYRFPNAILLANFLGLNQASFYSSLQRLHSVLIIPPASEADTKPIQAYHASFSDYLKDPVRSGKFFLEVPHLDIALSCLKWLGYCHKDPSKQVELEPTWIRHEVSRQTIPDSLSLRRFSFPTCWNACINVPENSLAVLFEELEKFDFNLDYTKWWEHETKDFVYFIRWLVTLEHHLVSAGNSREASLVIWHQENLDFHTLTVAKDMKPRSSNNVFLRLGIREPIHVQLEAFQGYSPLFYSRNPW